MVRWQVLNDWNADVGNYKPFGVVVHYCIVCSKLILGDPQSSYTQLTSRSTLSHTSPSNLAARISTYVVDLRVRLSSKLCRVQNYQQAILGS